MEIKYINAINSLLNLNAGNIKCYSSNILSHEWQPSVTEKTYGTRIKQFNSGAKTVALQLIINGSDAERKKAINTIYEYCDYDVRSQEAGKLYFNDYYVECYLINASVEPIVKIGGDTLATLNFYCANPFWIKKTITQFNTGGTTTRITSKNLDYAHDYEYDYTQTLMHTQIINDSYVDCDSIITVYGPVVNPVISIGGQSYGVECTLLRSQQLIIDTLEKTVVLKEADGAESNYFARRDKTNGDFFKKIPIGTSNVSWNSDFRFDITLIEQRSEPRWT